MQRMCLILFSYRHHPEFPLILAANRDEFHSRPTAPLGFWEDAPEILAGRDLKGGGAWMGVSRSGRFAALTNYRDPASLRPEAPSRGRLTTDFLLHGDAPSTYLTRVRESGNIYNGFNLLVMAAAGLFYYSNRGSGITPVAPGIHGLSNALLNTPWPKIKKGKAAMAEAVSMGRIDPESLLALLQDPSPSPDHQLPATGVDLEMERRLSPMFISMEGYGTRTSSAMIMDRRGKVLFWERTFPTDGKGGPETRRFCIQTEIEGKPLNQGR